MYIDHLWFRSVLAETVVQELGVDAEIIDLRTLVPLDTATILDSISKTSRVLILHEDTLFGGLGAEISALITENVFEYLDAPVMRCASLDTAVPFCAPSKSSFLPRADSEAAF